MAKTTLPKKATKSKSAPANASVTRRISGHARAATQRQQAKRDKRQG